MPLILHLFASKGEKQGVLCKHIHGSILKNLAVSSIFLYQLLVEVPSSRTRQEPGPSHCLDQLQIPET